jgi:hypothetical protein
MLASPSLDVAKAISFKASLRRWAPVDEHVKFFKHEVLGHRFTLPTTSTEHTPP